MDGILSGLGLGATQKEREETEAGLYKSTLADRSGGAALLIIDPQNDFHPGGSLAVPNSNIDAKKIASLIRGRQLNAKGIEVGPIIGPDEIFVTLDTHNKYHIAHKNFWKHSRGGHPADFTTISLKDVKSKTWVASRKEHQKWAEQYVATLEKNKNFQLCIWPEHCLIGTEGHAVYHPIMQALKEWEDKHNKPVHYIIKGNHALTEHYSALAAEVPVPGYPETELNTKLLNQLKKFDKVFVCGQARSHCVNFTVRDLVKNWKKEDLDKITVVEDASSSVKDFGKVGETFLKDMKLAGVKVVQKQPAMKELLMAVAVK